MPFPPFLHFSADLFSGIQILPDFLGQGSVYTATLVFIFLQQRHTETL